jgi:hypothetical protein
VPGRRGRHTFVLGDGRLTDHEAELEQLAVNVPLLQTPKFFEKRRIVGRDAWSNVERSTNRGLAMTFSSFNTGLV